jgi:hypothetical protein
VPGSLPWSISAHSALQRCSSQVFISSSVGNDGTGCHSLWRASRTFFSICPFSPLDAGLQSSTSNS